MRCQYCLLLSECYSLDLPRSWRWRTTLDSEMPISPDTLWMLLIGFAKVVKVTNNTGPWDADLAWYSLNVTHWICQGHEGDEQHWTLRCRSRLVGIYIYSLENNFEISGFRPTSACLIVDVLVTWVKCLPLVTLLWSTVFPLLLYCDQLCPTKFGVASIVLWPSLNSQNKKLPNQTRLLVHLYAFKITDWMKQCTTCRRTNYHD